jgi:hypothetical protein
MAPKKEKTDPVKVKKERRAELWAEYKESESEETLKKLRKLYTDIQWAKVCKTKEIER